MYSLASHAQQRSLQEMSDKQNARDVKELLALRLKPPPVSAMV
jgi:hypothetical protein